MRIMNDVKKEMKDRARLVKGLVNALKYDVDYILTDVKNYDVICLDESLREAKDTVQRLTDNLKEIEYLLYLMRQNEV
jgi:hypothetical protein